MITQDELCLNWAVKYIVKNVDLNKQFVIFDIGANIGDYIQLLNSNVQANLSIHSFEPNPKTFERLYERFGGQPNVKLTNAGLGSLDGKMTLYDPGNHGSAIASLYNRKAFENFPSQDQPIPIEVDLITIDSYIKNNNIKQVNYMKIDVEGHELEALKGAKESFEAGIVNAGQFEMGDTFRDAGITIEDFVSWFDTVGYSIFYRDIVPANLVRKTSDVITTDNWENLIFVKNTLI